MYLWWNSLSSREPEASVISQYGINNWPTWECEPNNSAWNCKKKNLIDN